MGLDKLGILFLIIVIPIALVLNTYTNTQVDTLNMQLEYDTKLNNSTYDAVKTYQINSLNEDASNLGDVRIGNINAAINVFFTSLSSNLNMSGYSRQFLQEYVPALVFTMYDGYYIYSKYTNKLDEADYATQKELNDVVNIPNGYREQDADYLYQSTYQDGQPLYGLKPFIHYSCRYKKGTEYDFVVSYTLDNYITIQGIVDGQSVDMSGYLIDTTKYDPATIRYDPSSKKAIVTVPGELKYRNVTIEKEDLLTDNLVLDKDDGRPETKTYPYHKVNGVKYYWGGSYWFSMLNGTDNSTNYDFNLKEDDSAYNYYVEAYEFTKRLEGLKLTYGPNAITTDDIADSYTVSDESGNTSKKEISKDSSFKIFKLDNIEEPNSNFNIHRQEVIRYTIEKNLSIAIANYNNYVDTPGYDFRMPEFTEEEWDRIQKNMTVISYLQGLPIGTKIYNGVSVVSNNVNEEVVSEESIYIADGPNSGSGLTAKSYNYYPVTKKDWNNIFDSYDPNSKPLGIYNVDLQRRQVEYNKQTYYYYPKLFFDTYSQTRDTVNLNAEKTYIPKGEYNYNGNVYKYIDEQLVGAVNPDPNSVGYKVAKAFYTALGREKKSRYNQRNNYEKLITKIPNDEFELINFNAQFKESTYKGDNKTAEEVQELVNIALDNNNSEPDINKRVVVRQGGYPTKDDYYVSGVVETDSYSSDITEKCVTDLYTWTTDNIGGKNYVVAKMGTSNTANGYKGDLSVTPGKKYNIRYYYYQGRIKAIYISSPY